MDTVTVDSPKVNTKSIEKPKSNLPYRGVVLLGAISCSTVAAFAQGKARDLSPLVKPSGTLGMANSKYFCEDGASLVKRNVIISK